MRKVNDPVVDYLEMWAWRAVMFVGLSVAQALALWMWFWMEFEHSTTREAIGLLFGAWPFDTQTLQGLMEIFLLWLGAANTLALYQAMGGWWRRRAEVLHRRGSRFFDNREK